MRGASVLAASAPSVIEFELPILARMFAFSYHSPENTQAFIRVSFGRLLLLFLCSALFAQQKDSSLRPDHAASLTIEVRNVNTGDLTPARVYLFRGAAPHRLSPVDNLLPLFEDNFYRERLWRMTSQPKSLEVDIRDRWHRDRSFHGS